MRLDNISESGNEDAAFWKQKAEAWQLEHQILTSQMGQVQKQLTEKIHSKIQDAIHIKLTNLKEWLAQSPDPMQMQDKTYAGIAINARSLVERLERVLAQIQSMKISY